MYDTYARYIYEWLTGTFYQSWQDNSDVISTILERIDSILTIVQYGLYLGVFAFLFWVGILIIRPHLFKT